MNRAVFAVLVGALAGCGPELASPPSHVAIKRSAVLSGRVTFDDPEIFAFQPPGFLCSSSLIGRRTLLTAGHCVTDEVTGAMIGPAGALVTNVPDSNHARWPNDYLRVTAIRRHPSYGVTPTGAPFNDVAMVQLEREPPVPLKVWNKDPLTPAMAFTDIRIVGYGVTDTGLEDQGLKRTGSSMLKVIDAKTFTYGKTGANKNGACQGDSGGPALKVFPDGTERVIGITSFDSGGCGANTDARVDAFSAYIQAGLDEYEASCAEDGACKAGCTPADPDCACIADGACNAACTGLTLDPDCANSCGISGVCSTPLANCAGQDPDCQPLGSSCGYADHCASRLCITSPQHTRPYCSQACTGPSGCPSTMDCVANQCQLKVLPAADPGQPCTAGATFCTGGGSMFCASWAKEPATVCRQACYEDADCEADSTCRPSPEAPGVCIANVTMTQIGTETLHPPQGCSSAPGALLTGLLGLLGLARRRR